MQTAMNAASLGDILERILDKGIVVAGDISVSLVGVELLTVRVRLVIASVDRALQMGIRWWEGDAALTGEANRLKQENLALAERIDRLEAALAATRAPALAGGRAE